MTRSSIPRPEYPRPEAKRDQWLCLNGEWGFEFDPDKVGMREQWFLTRELSEKITVPFVYQSKLSGIDSQAFIDTVWYSKTFKVPGEHEEKTILLHFGAVDYECNLFINSAWVGNHKGGVTPFTFDITPFLSENPADDQEIVLHVYNNPFDRDLPMGKQSLDKRFSGCDYQTITGIWQTVWLEFVNEAYLDRSDYFIRANPDTGDVDVSIQISGNFTPNLVTEAQVFDGKDPISEVAFQFDSFIVNVVSTQSTMHLKVDPSKITRWSPSTPKLYSVEFRIIDGDSDDDDAVLDSLKCSFGFRTFEAQDLKFYLNGEALYLKQPLYQGYWPDGLWTAPSDDAIKKDMELTLEMGYNSLRLHQKLEDPRLLYWADKMGIILWGEFANSRSHNARGKDLFTREWTAAVRRDRCHPSIMAWVPINESWGTGNLALPENQEWLKSLYHLTKTLDPTRMVVDNDGWEHVLTDIASIHDYSQPEVFATHYPENRPGNVADFLTKMQFGRKIFAPGARSRGEPIVISEWGGWGMNLDDVNIEPDRYVAWGYQGILYKSFDEILDLYERTMKELVKRKGWISGHCYTEFCDQYQEVNGMLTFDRRPKGDLSKLKKINDML